MLPSSYNYSALQTIFSNIIMLNYASVLRAKQIRKKKHIAYWSKWCRISTKTHQQEFQSINNDDIGGIITVLTSTLWIEHDPWVGNVVKDQTWKWKEACWKTHHLTKSDSLNHFPNIGDKILRGKWECGYIWQIMPYSNHVPNVDPSEKNNALL